MKRTHAVRILVFCLFGWLLSLPRAEASETAEAVYLSAQGRTAYEWALAAQFGMGSAEEVARVSRLLMPLVSAAQMEMPLVVVTPSEKQNMYALPGAIIVQRGMLALVTDDGELSVLLAHELGHLALDHPMCGIRRGLQSKYFLRRANRKAEAWQKALQETEMTETTEEALQEGAKAFVQAAMHAEIGLTEERAADRWAAALLPRVGVSKETAVGLWDHLKAAGISDASHSHPSYRERKKIYGGAN